jgi:hypothetical protein
MKNRMAMYEFYFKSVFTFSMLLNNVFEHKY